MIDSHNTLLLKRLAIVALTIAALYFVYTAGYDHGARETARTFREVTR